MSNNTENNTYQATAKRYVFPSLHSYILTLPLACTKVIQPIPSLLHWQLEHLTLIQEHATITSLSG